jgi:hypothetical protein
MFFKSRTVFIVIYYGGYSGAKFRRMWFPVTIFGFMGHKISSNAFGRTITEKYGHFKDPFSNGGVRRTTIIIHKIDCRPPFPGEVDLPLNTGVLRRAGSSQS